MSLAVISQRTILMDYERVKRLSEWSSESGVKSRLIFSHSSENFNIYTSFIQNIKLSYRDALKYVTKAETPN